MNKQIDISTELQQLISTGQAWEFRIIPKENNSDFIEFLTDNDSLNDFVVDEFEMLFGKHVITSYSIHYTKLYESFSILVDDIFLDLVKA